MLQPHLGGESKSSRHVFNEKNFDSYLMLCAGKIRYLARAYKLLWLRILRAKTNFHIHTGYSLTMQAQNFLAGIKFETLSSGNTGKKRGKKQRKNDKESKAV
jgi:hypothetical protein